MVAPLASRFVTLPLATVVLAGLAPLAGWASGCDDPSRRPSAAELTELRERWEGFSEEEREELRSRYAEIAKLEPKERRRLAERARRLDQMARRLYKSLDDEQRRAMEELPSAKRRELLHEIVVAEARETGQRVLAKLPPEDRRRLEQASPDERLEFFVEFRRRQSERIDRSMERMAGEVGISPGDLQRMASLPPEQRRARFLEMVKRRTIRAVQSFGLPEGIPRARWKRVTQLPPEEFYMALLNLRRHFPDIGMRWRTPAERDRERPFRQLHQSVQLDLDPAERIALSHLSPGERTAEIMRRKRERALQVIRSEELLPPEAIERLAASPNPRFFMVVRDLLASRLEGHRPRGPRSPRRDGVRRDGERRDGVRHP